MKIHLSIPLAGLALLLIPALPAVLVATPSALAQSVWMKRLILKDGSYQIVDKYEVHKDRVRFLSAERDDWEEIPYALVDWPATDKWNKEHQPGAKPEPPPAQSGNPSDVNMADAAKLDAEALAERMRTPLVAPGLHLPDRDGIFVLDNFQSIPELVHLNQSAGNLNRDTSHNVLRAAIASFHGAQEPIRINGQAARVRLHVDQPDLYVSIDNPSDQETPEDAVIVDTHGANSADDKNQYSSPDSRYVIVRVDVRPGERVIGAIRISRVGSVTQNEDIVPTNAQILPGRHWMKLTPKEPLPIGEYALMEILGPGVVNLDVWDFGISPNSPENLHPITPVKE